MNTLAVVGLLAAGVMGQTSSTTTTTSTTSSSSTSTSSTTAITTTPPVITTTTMGNMHLNGSITTPVWTYFNVTVTSVTVVEEFTTLCKEATTLTFNDCEYPATAGEVIVVTNCPCTVTTAVPTWTSSLCPPETAKPVLPPPVIPTHSTSVAISHPSPPPVQVAGASAVGNSDIAGFAMAAVALVLGFF
ncbi:hypothetical protein F4860DRAFT_508998 [Xylaria cubensis]|nr:hypothetical protein F4860DRAFT_508998 [Xylaria cubensis]